MTRTEISNSQDVIDSRDVIARIEELEAQSLDDELDGGLDEDEQEELTALKALQEEAEGYCPDWKYGATLIRDTYFKDYAQETAEDLGLINHNLAWPYTCIDWDEAARQLQQDYTAVEFDDVTYWVR